MTTQHTPTLYDGDSPEMAGCVDDVAIAPRIGRKPVAMPRPASNSREMSRRAFFARRAKVTP